MLSLALWAVGLGIVDSVNPASIGFLILLFPLLRRSAEGLWYVAGTFVTYFATGLLLHLGLAATVPGILARVDEASWRFIQLGAGIGLMALGLALAARKPRHRTERAIPRVAPFFLFLLGASNTIFDLPTSLPYLALLGRLGAEGAGLVAVVLTLLAYNLVYAAPMLALQIAFMVFHERLMPALARLGALLERANRAMMVGFPLLAGMALAADASLVLIRGMS